MANASSIAIAINILTAPHEAFSALRERPTFLFPLVLILIANAAVILTYYNRVDVAWLMDLSLPAAGQDMSPEQRENAIDAVSSTSPLTLGAVSGASIAFFVTVWFLVFATYLRLVSVVRHDEFRFKQWFCLVCWCSMPLIVPLVATMANLYFSDVEFLRPDRINPLSFTSLLDLDGLSGSLANRISTMMDVASIWAAVLLLAGYRHWTQVSWTRAIPIAVGPVGLLMATLYIFAN